MKRPHFEPVDAHVDFPAMEKEILAFWTEKKIFQKSLDATADRQEFVFFDGPPFATGLPHYGHLLAGTIKDIVPRYWTMRGRHVSRRFGWDCHGLPVENEMEKQFNISGKRDIEKLGIHFFNEACRSIVLRYTEQWETVVNRIGRWVDFEHQYRTMDATYMESIWWVFSRVWSENLVYQGFRVQPYCPRCATPLSNFEVTEGYKDTQSPSITVSFPVAGRPNVKFLVWTTTPWTLPSNVALAVGPEIRYVKIKDGDGEYILAKDRLGAYYKDASAISILEEMAGKDLVGMAYEPIFDYFRDTSDAFFRVAAAEFVSTEDGTGIVHIAPAFGEDDFGVGARLGLPIVCPVDDEGKFTKEIPEFAGQRVYDADDAIIRLLKARGRLIHRGTVQHRYPFCYRCDTALIYKAITTWFVKISPLKANMLENNQRIRWVPSHLQNGRFGKGIESAPDWNISRNRYWGTPIPVWVCGCGHKECVGGLSDLHRLVGSGSEAAGREIHHDTVRSVQETIHREAAGRLSECGIDRAWAERLERAQIPDNDIHRHIIDALPVTCPRCGEAMKRTPEVLDCWFESGSMPYAQIHYPFENSAAFDERFPADFIAEGLDQTRGWFYTLTVLASALFRKEAFKNVVVNGIILAEDGKKLSKRLKNYAPVEEILDKFGADALRLFLIDSPAVKAEDLRFSEAGVMEISRSALLPLWNAYTFFVTYATIDQWSPDRAEAGKSPNELDRWILSLLGSLVRAVEKEMEHYNLYRVVPLLVDYIDNLTNWYIRRSRRRFWKSENDEDKTHAYSTLHRVLVEFSKIMAPFLPFCTEAIYRNLCGTSIAAGRAERSVHLAAFPQAENVVVDEDLVEKMRLARAIVSMGRALRSRFSIKTRQPLRDMTVIIRDAGKRGLMLDMEPLVREELNVKEVRFSDDESAVVSLSAKANFKKLGKRLGPKMKEAAQRIESFSPKEIDLLEKGGTVDVLGEAIGQGDIEIRRTKREGVVVETQEDITVALNTEITRELEDECAAREFVNRVQNMRKKNDLKLTDRIAVRCACPGRLQEALRRFEEYIRSETLARSIDWGLDTKWGPAEEVEINDEPAQVQLTVVG